MLDTNHRYPSPKITLPPPEPRAERESPDIFLSWEDAFFIAAMSILVFFPWFLLLFH